VYPQFVELLGTTNFIFQGKVKVLSLGAVSQCGVLDFDLTHGFFPVLFIGAIYPSFLSLLLECLKL